MRVEIVQGDLTAQEVDALVNAANPGLLGGGGVDGAIHAAGGPAILRECRALRDGPLPNGLPTGEAVATTAGDLPARWVIHTVGPVYGPRASGEQAAALLRAAHLSSLRVAEQLGARSIAFPAISTGVYGYPLHLAAPVALGAVAGSGADVDLVRFVLHGEAALTAFARAARDLPPGVLSPG